MIVELYTVDDGRRHLSTQMMMMMMMTQNHKPPRQAPSRVNYKHSSMGKHAVILTTQKENMWITLGPTLTGKQSDNMSSLLKVDIKQNNLLLLSNVGSRLDP